MDCRRNPLESQSSATGGVKQVAAIALSVSTSGDGGGEGGTAEFELSEIFHTY